MSTEIEKFDEFDDENFGYDYIHDVEENIDKLEGAYRESNLSKDWAAKWFTAKKDSPEKIVQHLMKIRNTVRNLIRVHLDGKFPDLEVDMAHIGHIGLGAAGFRDLTNFQGPVILLDRQVYNDCSDEDVLDVYCGLGLHEGSHIKHTRLFYTRRRLGQTGGEMLLWENLLEDERIERLAEMESPGFAPYLQALRRKMYETDKHVLKMQRDFSTFPEVDKILMIIFMTLRLPYMLTREQKSFVTLTGHCPYLELRKLLINFSLEEKYVSQYADGIKKLYEIWTGRDFLTPEQMSKKIEEVAKDVAEEMKRQQQQKGEKGPKNPNGGSGKGEKPQQGGGVGGAASGGSGGQDAANEPLSGQPQEDSGDEGEKEKQDGEKDENSQEEKKDSGKNEKDESYQEQVKKAAEIANQLLERIQQAIEAAKEDNEYARKIKDLEERLKQESKPTDRRDKNYDLEAAKQEVMNGATNEYAGEALEKQERNVENIKKDIEALKKKREKNRFGFPELAEEIQKYDLISDGLSTEEGQELVQAEADRIIFGKEWKHGGMRRENIIVHPRPIPENVERYDESRKVIANHINAMRQIFRFRLGKREIVDTERIEGRLHRKMLAKAEITDRIFQDKYTRMDQGLSICLLIDNSGSMGWVGERDGDGVSKSTHALRVCILLAEALKRVPNVELEVYSYTSCGNSHQDSYMQYLYGKNNKNMKSIGAYNKGGNNYDHMAIENATKMFIENTTNHNRLMLVISDGAPNGYNYGGPSAIKATKDAVDAATKKGIRVIQIAIEGTSESKDMFKHVLNFTDIPNLVNNMKKLVTQAIREVTR